MKKILCFAFVIVLALALTMSACGDKGGSDSSDTDSGGLDVQVGGSDSGGSDSSDTDTGSGSGSGGQAEGWPKDKFPPDFPAYPNGVVTDVSDVTNSDMIMVTIRESDRESYDAFKAALIKAGWVFDNEDDDTSIVTKGNYSLILDYMDGIVYLGFAEREEVSSGTGGTSGDGGTPNDPPPRVYSQGWPSNLPYEIPKYPDGDMEYAYKDEDYTYTEIKIRNTTFEVFQPYMYSLRDNDGWALEVTDYVIYATKDKKKMTVLYAFNETFGGVTFQIRGS